MIRYNFSHARDFIYTSARLLERRLFAYLFEDGSPEAVKTALRAYQNPDGGFGNALEADLRTPASQPLAVERAFVALDLIHGFDDSLTQRTCDWLETITAPDGGVPFAVPGLEAYPHTPWMDSGNPSGQLNPTAGLCAFLLKHKVEHPWLERASAFCWQAIPGLSSEFFHDLMPVIHFLQHAPREKQAEAHSQLERIRGIVSKPGMVTLDLAAEGYVKFPLDWAPSPQSVLRPLFDDEIISRNLETLAAKQMPDGGWPINWQALGLGAEAEWRGVVTLETLLVFRAYGITAQME